MRSDMKCCLYEWHSIWSHKLTMTVVTSTITVQDQGRQKSCTSAPPELLPPQSSCPLPCGNPSRSPWCLRVSMFICPSRGGYWGCMHLGCSWTPCCRVVVVGWRSTRACRLPCSGCPCVCVWVLWWGRRVLLAGWCSLPVPRTRWLAWKENECESGERRHRWRCEGWHACANVRGWGYVVKEGAVGSHLGGPLEVYKVLLPLLQPTAPACGMLRCPCT